MKTSFDLAFKRPDGKRNVVLFSCRKDDYLDFLVQVYDSIRQLQIYEEQNDIRKRAGKYTLTIYGSKRILPGENISFGQYVNETISYSDMFKSLINATISDIVGRIYLEEKGELSGSRKNRPDNGELTEGNGTSPDGIQGTSAAT
jgi:hypothetical protein